MNNDNYSIAIDGPSASGKSTIAKEVAKKLNIEYIDTGAMYRALTYKVLKNKIDVKDTQGVIEILKNTNIDFINNSIYLDGVIVDKEIRQNIVSKNVSYIARIKEVREILVHLQQSMAKTKNVIMDGRDIGTVVLPDANYKFYVTASVDERARRRYKELLDRGEKNISLEDIVADIVKRDEIDSNREIGPLIQAEDAHVLDTTNRTIDESVDFIISIVTGGS
ncbi:MAG: (d)CMP kinase [Tissierellaceae bacterium]|jgi:cytidylate kinase|nr:(d)CMP kinase [Tissierellia bacterium]